MYISLSLLVVHRYGYYTYAYIYPLLRAIVSKILDMGMHDVMLSNDQLISSMEKKLVLQNFTEPPLNFRPTYKLDIDSDAYDSGSKKRIPAWTDRVLYVETQGLFFVCIPFIIFPYTFIYSFNFAPNQYPLTHIFNLTIGLVCTAYDSDRSLKSSDHRPVYASFSSKIEIGGMIRNQAVVENININKLRISQPIPNFTSESQVCSVS